MLLKTIIGAAITLALAFVSAQAFAADGPVEIIYVDAAQAKQNMAVLFL